MLLDKYLPEYHFNEIHSVKINADAEKVLQAVKELRTNEIHKIMKFLTDIRSIPNRIKGENRKSLNHSNKLLDTMYENKFYLLEENLNELVIGLIGKFWKLSNVEEIKISSKEQFLNFNDFEYGIVGCNMLFEEGRLTTETRIMVNDSKSRMKFRLYWFIIRIGSGIIRKVWLRAIKRKAESYI